MTPDLSAVDSGYYMNHHRSRQYYHSHDGYNFEQSKYSYAFRYYFN